MKILRRGGYIETEAVAGGVSVRILKAKKFPQGPQGVRRNAGGIRKTAEGRPHNCGANASDPQWNQQFAGGIDSSYIERFQEESNSQEIHNNFHNPDKQHQNPSGLENTKSQNRNNRRRARSQGYPEQRQCFKNRPDENAASYDHRQFMAEARVRLQLLRAEREEAVRRELYVGTAPEVTRR